MNTTITLVNKELPTGPYSMVWINLTNATGILSTEEFSSDLTITSGPILLTTPFQLQSGPTRLLLTITPDATSMNGTSLLHLYLTRATLTHDSQTIILLNNTMQTNATTINAQPLVNFTINGFYGSITASLGDTLYFNASACNDPEGEPLTYQWDFGDGENSTDQLVLYRYRAPGKYTVTLTVSDGSHIVQSTARVEIEQNDGDGDGPG